MDHSNIAVSLAFDPAGRPLLAIADDGEFLPRRVAHNGPHATSDVQAELRGRPDNPYTTVHVDALQFAVSPGGTPMTALQRTSVTTHLGSPPTYSTHVDVHLHEAQTPTPVPTPGARDASTLRVDAQGAAWLFQDRRLLRRQDGPWELVGPPSPEGTFLDFQLMSGRPVILRYGQVAGVQQFELLQFSDDSVWSPLAAPLPLQEDIPDADLRIDPVTGQPVIAWSGGYFRNSQEGYRYVVRVMRWSGTEWVSIGDPIDLGKTLRVSSFQLELDALGRPTVAWHEHQATGLSVARYRP